MDDKTEATLAGAEAGKLRSLWLVYRRRIRALHRARVQLDEEIERVLAWGEGDITQSDLARVMGATRQDIQESVRRQARRRERGEIP
jgi:hypothetical protein